MQDIVGVIIGAVIAILAVHIFLVPNIDQIVPQSANATSVIQANELAATIALLVLVVPVAAVAFIPAIFFSVYSPSRDKDIARNDTWQPEVLQTEDKKLSVHQA